MIFDVAFDRVFINEGEFQNDPSDRGNWTSGQVGVGELKGTKFGISAMSYPGLDIEHLSRYEAKQIYKRDWWDAFGMDQFRPAMSYQMFDAAIHHGMFYATTMVQRAAGTTPDGVIGPKTRAAVASKDINDLLMLFLAVRLEFMTNVSTWRQYGRGWARRIAHNLRLAAEDN